MEHGRLHWFEPAELDADQRRVYRAVVDGPRSNGAQAITTSDTSGRLYGPFNAMLVDPLVGDRLQALGAALRFESELPGRWREIAILETAVHRKSEFEWFAHHRIGMAAGLSQVEIDAIRHGAHASTFDANELLVRSVAQSLLVERDLSDARYADAMAQLGVRTLSDLVYLVGYYELLALSLAVFRVPLPPDAHPSF